MRSNNRENGRSTVVGQGKVIAVASITLLAGISLIVYALTRDTMILEFCRWVIILVAVLTIGSARELFRMIKELLRRPL